MLIEITATEESRFPSQHRTSDPAWSRKKKDGASGNERFFVGQNRAFGTDAKAVLLHSLLQFDVALLRMTIFNTDQQLISRHDPKGAATQYLLIRA
jgi:hypothetical protein